MPHDPSSRPKSPRKPRRPGRAGPRAAAAAPARPSRQEESGAGAAASPPPVAGSLARHVLALEALGWRVIELRPSRIRGGEVALWRVAILRVDLDASMTVTSSDPLAGLAELARYASADARKER
jgi:hypothetical protein